MVFMNPAKNYRDVLVFIIILFISLWLFYFLESFLALETPLIWLFHALGYVNTKGILNTSMTNISITYQCSGFFSILVYFAIIFSPITKLSLRKKFIAFFSGFFILYFANILRLFLIFWFCNIFGLTIIHVLGWFLMSGIIFLLWYFFAIKPYQSKSMF